MEKEPIYVGNGGIFGFEKGIREKMIDRIAERAEQDENEGNRVSYVLEVMSDEELARLLAGNGKADQKTIKQAFKIAKKKILKEEVKYILDEKVAIDLNVYGLQIDKILSNMKNSSYLEETFGELSEEDKNIIRKCINECVKDIESRIAKGEKFESDIEFDEDNEEEQDQEQEQDNSNIEQDVMPIKEDKKGLKNRNAKVDTISKRVSNEVVRKPDRSNSSEEENYYQEVLRFTNEFAFFAKDSMIYASETGHREKFKNLDNYKKFYILREKVQRIMNEKHVSEEIAMVLLLNDLNMKLDSEDRQILTDASERIRNVKKQQIGEKKLDNKSERM